MSLAVRDQADALQPPRPSRQTSKLLAQLFGSVDRDRRLTLLDLGRALPETVDFLSQFRCKVHVVDLYSELESGRISCSRTGVTVQRQFQQLFGFPRGTCLDICFLWDLPHYLDEKLLRALGSALWPWLHAESRAHAFGVHSAATTLRNHEYGIVDLQTLSIRTRRTAQLAYSPHPQSFMHEWLTCFATRQGVLLPDGKVELLMHSTI